jgi:tRNA A-37 threonylcarbamoyl transferase component Bud32
MIELSCSGCGATLVVQDDSAGKGVECAECGAQTLVPAAGGEAETTAPCPTNNAPAGAGPPGGVLGYEVLGELGRGGMGVVYKARHVKLGRLVALKMILAAEYAGQEERARFQTEAEAVARLQHPNIVQIYEVGEQDGRPFFSLEFCAGGSLEKKLGGVPLPPQEAARLAETLARAMHAAHEAGVVHRDLKPANVLLAKDGTPKITDFGLAKKLDEAGQTATGAVMGTPSYMAPEQAGGKAKAIGPHTDVYALGAILYEFLTGRPPFRAATKLDTIMQVLSDDPVPPARLQPKVPRDLETICLKCLRKESAKRYASADELADDLRRFLDGAPVRARPTTAPERAVKWVRRHPARAGLIAVVVLAAVGFAAGGGWYNLRLRKALDDAEQARARERRLLEQQLATANRELARRNLHFLAVAMFAYQEADRGQRFPPAAVCAPDGRPLLSWRVLLLPHLGVESQALYRQFKLDEPWDGPHNRGLLDRIPDVYTPATGSVKERHLTYYRVFTGPETPFSGTLGPRMPADFQDGTSNTFLIVEAGEPVPWTKPDELPYSSRQPLPKLGGLLPDGFHAGLADGSVVFVSHEEDEATIRAYITPRGGEQLHLSHR